MNSENVKFLGVNFDSALWFSIGTSMKSMLNAQN